MCLEHNMEQHTKDLMSIRENVQVIDQQLLENLATRRKLSIKIAACKANSNSGIRNFPVEHNRLGVLIEKGKELGLDAFSVSRFYQNIIEDSVLTQHAYLHRLENPGMVPEKPAVAILGGEGAYSQFAAKKYFSFTACAIEEKGKETFHDVLAAVEDGSADYGILPFMNSLTGLIEEACQALLDTDLEAVGEVYLPIEHCLLGKNWNYPISNIRNIYAHPQVFAQCRPYLNTLKGANLVPVKSTTHALVKVCEGRVNETAIGSAIAGNIFGLKTMKSNIHGDKQNYTRFLVIAKHRHRVPKEVEAKTTLAFVPEAGTLTEILLEFHDRDISLSHLETLPGGPGLWDKIYLVDILRDCEDPKTGAAIEVLKTRTDYLKVLGSYPSGRITSFFGV